MNLIFLLLFVSGTAPILQLHTPGGFELNKEMDIFKELLQNQFETAEAEVKELKLKETNCKNVRACNNQNLLFKELMKAYRSKNSTFQNFLSKVSPSRNTTKDSKKSSFLKM